jgi:tetratricopeptide (TPR) repeat protein
LLCCPFVTVALLFANSVVNPVQAADTANETRAISQQVLALIKTSNLDEAETLAKRGLLLCEDAGDVKVFCVGQFNDSLGDIAYARSEYSSALAYYEQALRVREAGLGNGHLLTTRSQLRVGKAHMALHRGAEAEGFVKRAVAGFEKVTPVNRELALALGYLRNIYLDADRIDDAVIIARRELDAYEKSVTRRPRSFPIQNAIWPRSCPDKPRFFWARTASRTPNRSSSRRSN